MRAALCCMGGGGLCALPPQGRWLDQGEGRRSFLLERSWRPVQEKKEGAQHQWKMLLGRTDSPRSLGRPCVSNGSIREVLHACFLALPAHAQAHSHAPLAIRDVREVPELLKADIDSAFR